MVSVPNPPAALTLIEGPGGDTAAHGDRGRRGDSRSRSRGGNDVDTSAAAGHGSRNDSRPRDRDVARSRHSPGVEPGARRVELGHAALSAASDEDRSPELRPRQELTLTKCHEIAASISAGLGSPHNASRWPRQNFPEAWCSFFAKNTTHTLLDDMCFRTLSNCDYVQLIGIRATKRQKLEALWSWAAGDLDS